MSGAGAVGKKVYEVVVWCPTRQVIRMVAADPETAARRALRFTEGQRSGIEVTWDDENRVPTTRTYLTFDGVGLNHVAGRICS